MNTSHNHEDNNSENMYLLEISYDREYIQDRSNQIKQLEQDMIVVHDIVRDLNEIVHEQSYGLDSIEQNIQSASQNTDEGVHQLTRASKYQKKSRKLLCWALSIVIVVIGILIITLILK